MTQKQQAAVSELRRLRQGCAVHNMTFDAHKVGLTEQQKGTLEEVQHSKFLVWWDSWVVPQLDILDSKP